MAIVDDKDLQIMIKAAHAGGEVLRKYFGQALDVVEKSTIADFQTKADLESEKSILTILKAEFPRYNIISEEEGETRKNSDYTFVVDPLDGTNNFVIGLPLFSVSIGLLYKNEAVAGVVYQPITNQTFCSIKGKGSYLNGTKINVNNNINLKNFSVEYSFSYKIQTEKDYVSDMIDSLYRNGCKRIMCNWSVAFELCMLASGKIESIICDNIELHDFAAGKLIALEAGAKIIDFSGKKEKNYINSKFIISNTEKVNKYILSLIKPLQKGR